MIGERDGLHDDHKTRERVRSALRVPQPQSTAALRPSQRRAAEHRGELAREQAVARWLRRIVRR